MSQGSSCPYYRALTETLVVVTTDVSISVSVVGEGVSTVKLVVMVVGTISVTGIPASVVTIVSKLVVMDSETETLVETLVLVALSVKVVGSVNVVGSVVTETSVEVVGTSTSSVSVTEIVSVFVSVVGMTVVISCVSFGRVSVVTIV